MEWAGKEGKKDGFIFILTQMTSVLPEGKLLWGGPCRKVEVEEVEVEPMGGKGSKEDPGDPHA